MNSYPFWGGQMPPNPMPRGPPPSCAPVGIGKIKFAPSQLLRSIHNQRGCAKAADPLSGDVEEQVIQESEMLEEFPCLGESGKGPSGRPSC